MRSRSKLLGVFWLASVICALAAAGAPAQPAAGPRERVDQAFTTIRPHTPTGLRFAAVFHAAQDPAANPPYIRRVVIDLPGSMRYDTSVPPQCTASDPQLQLLGPKACPAGSVLGAGKTEGLIFEPVMHDFTFDHYKHDLYVVNGPRQQILLVKSEGYTVVRSRVRPDGRLVLTPPACFPAPPTGCVDNYVLTLRSATDLAPYTREVDGRTRAYATTPGSCPARGYWRTRIAIDWVGGARDLVGSREPCRA